MSKILNHLLARRNLNYLLIDQDFKIITLSDGVEKFADAPQEVRIGHDIRSGFPELVGIEQELQDVMDEKTESFSYSGIGRPLEPNSPFYLDLYVTNYQDTEFPEAKLILLVEDVTEKMSLEQSLVQASNEATLLIGALTASRDYIDKVITAISDALLVTNLSGQIKTVNLAAQEILGYDEAELLGQPITMILPAKEQQKSKITLYQHLFAYDKFPKDVEVTCQKKTGEELIMLFSCSPVQTNVKGIYDCVYIGRDMTIRKQQEQQLRQDLADQQAKSALVAEITQDLEATINQLLSATQVLQTVTEASGTEALAPLHEIQVAGNALRTLLNQLKS